MKSRSLFVLCLSVALFLCQVDKRAAEATSKSTLLLIDQRQHSMQRGKFVCYCIQTSVIEVYCRFREWFEYEEAG